MKLIDILSFTNDSTNINVYDEEDNLISNYDGRNSIDEKLNNLNVDSMYVKDDTLCVKIYEI